MLSETREFILMADRVSKAVEKLPARIATEAVNFSKDRFRDQSWIDNRTEPWKKRKPIKNESNRRASRATLVDTGRLRRSIRKIEANERRVVIGTDAPYAQANNDGFRGKVSQRVRAHSRRVKLRDISIKAHNRSINQNIPRRRFIGQSALLNKKIERLMIVEIKRAAKG